MDEQHALERLRELEIETPSWGYGNSGTRFHVYPWPGAARTVHERIADAALVHRLTGCCPSVALHIPWDARRRLRRAPSVRRPTSGFGSARSTRTSSATTSTGSEACAIPTRASGARALDHCRRVHRDRRPRSDRRSISLWLADGTNYPGQDDLPTRATHGCSTASSRSTRRFPPGCGCSSSTSSSSRASTAPTSPTGARPRSLCRRLGPQAQVLVDTGPPPQGTNVEQIVARAARRGAARRLPLQQPQVRRRRPDRRLDRPVRALPDHARDRACAATPGTIAFMIDQSHNIEGKIDAMIQSVMNIQTAYAKALLVDEAAAGGGAGARETCSAAHRILLEAFETDVRPLLARLRGSSASRTTRSRHSAQEATPSGSPRERGVSARRERVRTAVSGRVRIALFVTCVGDTSVPRGRRRRRFGCWSGSGTRSSFPPEQTCCGQMHLNSGYRKDARAARPAVRRVFGEFEAVVSPSSSCVGDRARGSNWRRWTNASSSCRSCSCSSSASTTSAHRSRQRVAYHPTCHSLRVTRVGDAPLRLLRNVRGLELVELADAERVLRLRRDVRAQERRHVERDARRQVRCDRGVRRRVCARHSTAPACCRSAAGSRGDARRPAPSIWPRSSPRRDDAFPKRLGSSSRTRSCGRTSGTRPTTIRAKRARVVAELPDWEELRDAGKAIKADVLAHLDELPASSSRARSWRPAGRCTGLATQPRRTRSSSRSHGRTVSTEVVKVKSLTTDEIELNAGAGRGRHPRARDRFRRADPAARRRLVVAHPRPGDPPEPDRDPRPLRADDRARHRVRTTRRDLAEASRLYLREQFLDARVGVSGANFGDRGDRDDLRRRVRGERAHVHDAAAGARHRSSGSRSSCRRSPTSRSSCSCCRARRRASG